MLAQADDAQVVGAPVCEEVVLSVGSDGDAVRFQGRDITRRMTAAAGALKLGLQVWLSSEMFEQSCETTLAYLVRAAAAAESRRQRFPGRLVFCVGTESSLFTRG